SFKKNEDRPIGNGSLRDFSDVNFNSDVGLNRTHIPKFSMEPPFEQNDHDPSRCLNTDIPDGCRRCGGVRTSGSASPRCKQGRKMLIRGTPGTRRRSFREFFRRRIGDSPDLA
ncbi:MAG: hypothetical protein J0L84_14690, partial [Verrucomicrobia bacterium]|nr:hypothetical protein [Verrucomicrobiota bacterium]